MKMSYTLSYERLCTYPHFQRKDFATQEWLVINTTNTNIPSQGNYVDARRHYEIAAKLDPNNVTLKQNMAKLIRVEVKGE